MEQKINHIYSKTYNYVYLRAKSILQREEDIQQLMRDVYVKMLQTPEVMEPERVYEWLGRNVYAMGSSHYRKRKVREEECLELDEQDLTAAENVDLEDSISVIEEHLGGLPDLYHAIMYAFYYDYMTIEDIAELMDYTEGSVIYALNYTKKYMMRALEDYYDETKVQVAFSAEAVRGALRKWSVENCLGLTVAQSVYSDICKSANLQATALAVEGKEFAGVNHTVVYHEANDWELTKEQIEVYGSKRISNKKMIEMLVKGAVIVAVLVVLVLIGIVINNSIEKNSKSDKKPSQKKESLVEPDQPEDVDEPEEPVVQTPTEAKYILPDSATRELTRSDLAGLSKEQLRLARNEIFARYGVVFGVADLDEYFAKQSWFTAKMTIDEFQNSKEIEMSAIEEKNLSVIVKAEDELAE